MASKLGIYWLWNIDKGAHGEVFAMCARHGETYRVDGCILTKLGTADDPPFQGCQFCEQESEQESSAHPS